MVPPEGPPVAPARDVRAVAEDERAASSAAARTAQALHTTEELLRGVRHHEWRVRCESVVRLAARWPEDPRTRSALLVAAVHDRSWEVRDTVVLHLGAFRGVAVTAVLQAAAHDPHADVRWSARFALFQKGLGEDPGPVGRCDDPWCPCCNGDGPDGDS